MASTDDDHGHDPGHRAPGLTWGDYVRHLVLEHGSLALVAQRLVGLPGMPDDVTSIERALRRLRARGHHDGGTYGRRLLDTYGLPQRVERWARWMGSYHSRFTDLPVSLCLEQLRVWDRPPVSESGARAWLQLGFASCAMRRRDAEGATAYLERARILSAGASADCRVEIVLFEAFVARERGDHGAADAALARAGRLIDAGVLPPEAEAHLLARWLDQRAFGAAHPPAGRPDLAAALALYERMPAGEVPPFVACKRDAGTAYVRWKLGDVAPAAELARAAARHAGDGGMVRLRINCLNLLAHILGDSDEARSSRERAVLMARRLEDEELLARLATRDGA